MHKVMQRFVRDENGATAIEYGMIAGLVIVAIVGAIMAVGQGVANTLYANIQTAL